MLGIHFIMSKRCEFSTCDQHGIVGIVQEYKIITEKIRDGVYAKDSKWSPRVRRKGKECSQVTRETPKRPPLVVHHAATQETVHAMPCPVHATSSGEVTIIAASDWGRVPNNHPRLHNHGTTPGKTRVIDKERFGALALWHQIRHLR